MGNCRRLKSIGALDGQPKLKKLEFDICPNIENFDALTNLPGLESLKIDDCKNVQSLSFITAFQRLKELSLLGNTTIVDGNLEYAKSLQDVWYKPRAHYNIIIENKKHDAITATNMAKLKKIFRLK